MQYWVVELSNVEIAMNKKNTAFIIGNGETRKGFDIALLKPHGSIFACGMTFSEYTDVGIIDKTVTVEKYRLDMIEKLRYPSEKVLYPTDETEQYEDIECWREILNNPDFDGQTPRLNAGSYSVKKAIEYGNNIIYMLGLDFIIEGDECVSNMFAGKPETRCSFEDSKRRVLYMDWLFRQYPAVDFVFVLKDRNSILREFPKATNMSYTYYDILGRDIIYRQTVKRKNK